MTPGDLARDTAVTKLAVAPGWYTAELSNAWDFRTPSGGALMTVAMRAMQEELGDPGLRPLSANTHFCSPVPAGPLEVRVEVLRHGGAAAQVRAQLSSTTMPGPGLEVSATFARDRDGVDLIDTAPPPVPPPDRCASFDVEPITRDRPPFFANLESRLAQGHMWWTKGWTPGPARIARWFRYRVPQRLADGRFDPLAIPPIADTMPPALIQQLGPDHEPFFAPSLDLTIHFLADTNAEWILTAVHVPRARAGYATANAEIWDDRGRLIATATQMMLLRRVPDAPLSQA
ncbi:MAG TPA: thioesterase family protein [Candidatus Dormibacteraeota bacterium]|nr:thioesterase family protein [Candidatus Dormibacteraeota bacterium]